MAWPKDVGILAIEVYFPYLYVDQSELEVFDNVSTGKYTIGLGQDKMGFCSDIEDINSLCLTVVSNLLEQNHIDTSEIGRLEVGTETIIDKSKSVKTFLMQLFKDNTDVEGIDTTNACYGGTSALFNCINWIESSAWDGRYALVVCGDIAVYASGNARPTGGAGAVAMLIGPHAPIIFERGIRSSHMKHAYDFYKPDLMSEYPVVDGKLSVECYLSALDQCYQLYKKKVAITSKGMKESAENSLPPPSSVSSSSTFTIQSADAFLFHSPYCKLVQKSLARLLFNDFLSSSSSSTTSPSFNHDDNASKLFADLERFRNVNLKESYFNKDLETSLMNASRDLYNSKTKPYLYLSNQIGNMYTPSLYAGLAVYIFRHKTVDEMLGKTIVLFSYGSGLASSMFSIKISNQNTETLTKIHNSLKSLSTRLESRKKVEPLSFQKMMKLREETHHLAPYEPISCTDDLFPGTFYLKKIDEKHRRTYERKVPYHLNNGTSASSTASSLSCNHVHYNNHH
ncbi:hypothetical protein HELRODRAFT_185341 [Helobdella robusta]|uniref:Hydroxymethylglutaryl-CoA synthase n=1 Tax=Helobdella robusta TaxID=6412 RepID=T1FMP5_HELRO|nr:hypothetical protein HELRODRAFT_185341 [Helobdella robusta]ESO09369.1 hypothetical protein HELRODRAFT_185341 [Helobdella robusta]